ncbi:MAG: beta-N-acetylhexosaminidase [Proteobacteria bacterium]|nr:beta-N-acetylhexosaminidase [Pseudomonadota bacterium]
MSRPDEVFPNAVIYGCEGTRLSRDEVAFFSDANPLGLILFARNIESPGQICALIQEFIGCASYASPLILIDQEGGRVARLGPPNWRETPPARMFGDLYRNDPLAAIKAAKINATLQALELVELGINVNCTPVADLSLPETHGVIGDRAFAGDPDVVAALSRAVCEGHMECGVVPVIKHIPGHGRATADSHLELPVVSTTRLELEKTDFLPFRILCDMPAAMTAHIVYRDIDPAMPATQSESVISDIIRGHLQFDGLVLSDDLGMQALDGGFAERAERALQAGCDVVLHCSGALSEMQDIANVVYMMDGKSQDRLDKVVAICGRRRHVDKSKLSETLTALLAV